jgi:hypothetical protein
MAPDCLLIIRLGFSSLSQTPGQVDYAHSTLVDLDHVILRD